MAYHLIGNDATVRITLGGVASGVAPTYNTSNRIDLTGDHLGVDIDDDLETVNVSGVGDTRRYNRSKRAGSSISIENYVLSTGPRFGGGATNALGQYAKVEVMAVSSLSAYVSYEGIVTRWGHKIGDDEQREPIVILCDAEHN